MRVVLLLPLLMAALISPGTALAEATSLITLGAGANIGLSHSHTTTDSAPQAFSGGLDVELRLLKVIGLGVSYAPWDEIRDDNRPVMSSQLKLSALLHIVPTTPVGFYIKGGIGGADPTTFFQVGAETNSYHGGGGFTIHATGHIVLGIEYLLMIRGHEAWLPQGLEEAMSFGVDDVLHSSAHRFTVSVWYFL